MADRYWVGGTGNWDNTTTHWSATSGGPAGASVPTAADDVYFDANSGGGVVTVNTSARLCNSLSFRGLSGNSDFTGSFASSGTGSNTISGGLNLSPSTTYTSYTATFTFNTSLAGVTITNAGAVFFGNMLFNGTGIWILQDGFTVRGTVTLTAGTLSLVSYTHTFNVFSSSNSNARTIDFGTSTVNITNGGGTVWTTQTSTNLTVLGTNPTVNFTYSGATGTRIIPMGTLAESSTINVNITSGTDTVTLSGNIKSINFTGFSGVFGIGNTINIYRDFTLSSTQTVTATSAMTFAGTSTTQTITSNGVTISFPITINSTTTTVQNSGALTTTAALTLTSGTFNINANLTIGTASTFTFTAGTINANNGANITCGLFSSANTNTRTLNMGSGTWTITGTGNVWNCGTSTNMTLNAQQSRILLNNTANPTVGATFAGGGLTYYTVEYARGAATATNTISGSNTFANFIDNTSTVAHTYSWASGTTQTFYKFNVRGSAGALITMGRSGLTTVNFVKVGQGIVNNCDYVSANSTTTATPANTWYLGANGSGGGGGWILSNAPSSQSLLGAGGVG